MFHNDTFNFIGIKKSMKNKSFPMIQAILASMQYALEYTKSLVHKSE